MMQRWVLLSLCMSLSICGSAYGDLRVLFRFDHSGIQAHRVVKIAEAREKYPASAAELPVSASVNVVIMTWLDGNGQRLAVTHRSDPRIASSPEHMNPASVSRVGLTEGAWVENGPDGSETVIIDFPENEALGLVSQMWSVSLRQGK